MRVGTVQSALACSTYRGHVVWPRLVFGQDIALLLVPFPLLFKEGPSFFEHVKCLCADKSAGSGFARKPRRGEPQGGGEHICRAEAILGEWYMDVPPSELRM